MAYRYPPGFRWQHRPQTSAWPLVVTWNMDIDPVRVTDPDLVLHSNMDPDIILALRWQYRLLRSMTQSMG